MLLKKNHKINFFLSFLLIIFTIFTYFTRGEEYYGFLKPYGELGYVQTLQNLILGYCLIVTFKLKKMFLKVSNSFTFYLRSFLIIVILFEELNFLITNFFNNVKNVQGSFSIHNTSFFGDQLFTLTIHPLDFQFTLIMYQSILIGVLFILGFGSYFPLFKKIKYFFLERKYGYFLCFYICNVFLSSIIRRTIDPNIMFLIHEEFCELFFYIIFLFDILEKKYNIKKIIKNNKR